MKPTYPLTCHYEDQYKVVAIWPEGVDFPLLIVDASVHFDIETRGPWGCVSKVSGLAVAKEGDTVDVIGVRCLLNAEQSGHQMEGKVSVHGKKYRTFTSSQLFWINGILVDVAVLYVCTGAPNQK